jgi:hypothetical protein
VLHFDLRGKAPYPAFGGIRWSYGNGSCERSRTRARGVQTHAVSMMFQHLSPSGRRAAMRVEPPYESTPRRIYDKSLPPTVRHSR